MCSSRNNPYPPHGRSSEIPRGRGILKVKILEATYEAKPEFRGGIRGCKTKKPSMGEYGYFLELYNILAEMLQKPQMTVVSKSHTVYFSLKQAPFAVLISLLYLINLGKFPLKQRSFKILHVHHDKIVTGRNSVQPCGSGPQKSVIC